MTHPRLTQEQIAEIDERHEHQIATASINSVQDWNDKHALLSHLRSMTLTEEELAVLLCEAFGKNPRLVDGYGDPSVPGGFREFEAWEEFLEPAKALLPRLTGAKP